MPYEIVKLNSEMYILANKEDVTVYHSILLMRIHF